ncbi:MAG: hypothetical protein ACOC44_15645 [Promethearchaeia archaeon]
MGKIGLFSRDDKEEKFDIRDKFQNVQILVDSDRAKEAIAYIYLIYNELMKHEYDKPRLAHQTIREYAITCVNELDQNPGSVYTFIKKIEDIIYGGVEPTVLEINKTINLFSALYKEITNKSFSYNIK